MLKFIKVMDINSDAPNIKLKIDFNEIFFQPFNWTNKNKKIAQIDSKKESNKRSFINDISESFMYLKTLYEEINFTSQNINIIDFLISSIIFWSLIEKITIIDVKLKSEILKGCNFSKIINNNFKTKISDTHTIDESFIEKYIGKSISNNNNYELQFLKGIRNKLIHPNGQIYQKTHMYSIGTHKEHESEWFPFGECYFVEKEKNRAPTFFVKKTIFLESIIEISKFFSEKISKCLQNYITINTKKNKPSLDLSPIEEAFAQYSEYFEDWEEISLLFIWSKDKSENKDLIQYLRMVYTIAKFMKNSNNITCDWKQWILPNIDEDIEKLMYDCGHTDSTNYLRSKMAEESWPETEWLKFFGKKQSSVFLKMYDENKIIDYSPSNIEEKFLIVIFNKKTKSEFSLLLKKLKLAYEKLKLEYEN